MARGKHATALFDVIRQAKQVPGNRMAEAEPAAPTPWFVRGKDKPADSPLVNKAIPLPANPPALTAGVVATTLPAPTQVPVMMEVPDPSSAPSSSVPGEGDAFEEFMSAQAANVTSAATVATKVEASWAATPAAESAIETPPAAQGVHWSMDTARKQVALHLSYKSAIAGGCGIAAAVLLAFLVGKTVAGSNAPDADEPVVSRASLPKVLDNDRNPAAPAVVADGTNIPKMAKIPPVAPSGPSVQPKTGGSITALMDQPKNDPAKPSAKKTTNGVADPVAAKPAGRVIGQHYIIVQSYPDADAARVGAADLSKAGIPATVEKTEYAPRWYSVVTVQGFDKVTGGDCERLIRKIRDVAAASPANAPARRFDPRAYRWREGKSEPKG